MPTVNEEIQFWKAGTRLLYVTLDDTGKLISMAPVEVVSVSNIYPVFSSPEADTIQSFRATYYVKSTGVHGEARNPIQRKRQIEAGKAFSAKATDLYTLDSFIALFSRELMKIEHNEDVKDVVLLHEADEPINPEDLKGADNDENIG